MLGFSLAQETVLAKKELQSTEHLAGVAQKYLSQEGGVLESEAADASGRVEREGKQMLSLAQQEVLQ